MEKKEKVKEQLQNLQQRDEMLAVDKKCPRCGARMTVCYQHKRESDPPKLNLFDRYSPCEYYCPHCKAYFPEAGKYEKYETRPAAPFEGGGVQYAYLTRFITGTVSKKIFPLSIMFGGSLVVFVKGFQGVLSGFSMAYWFLCVLSGVAALVSGYFDLCFFRLWLAGMRSYYEPAEQGLIFNDGASTFYLPWSSFRLVCEVDMGEGVPNGYAFDTEEKSFLINSNVEKYEELVDSILEKIADIAVLDSGATFRIFRSRA